MPRYIDEDKLIEFIENRYEITWADDYEGGIKDACTDILEFIEKQPTADVVERKMGKWIKHKDRACWYCSECTADNYYAYILDCDSGEYEQQDNFCPNCGADMRGEEE